jgi:hypothetical protein
MHIRSQNRGTNRSGLIDANGSYVLDYSESDRASIEHIPTQLVQLILSADSMLLAHLIECKSYPV